MVCCICGILASSFIEYYSVISTGETAKVRKYYCGNCFDKIMNG